MRSVLPDSNPIIHSAKKPTTISYTRVYRLTLKIGIVLLVFGLALFLRWRAVQYVGIDDDEATYLRAGEVYAQDIAAGNWLGLINERINYEQPPLTKLVFGAIFYAKNDYIRPVQRRNSNLRGQTQRYFNAIVGATTAGAVALVNPIAGLLVAVSAWHIKYTSESYLEALPCLFAALSLLALRQSRCNGDKWWWLAAIAMGLTASGKYLYAVASIAVIIWMLLQNRHAWRWVLVWVGTALLVFVATDPALWSNPLVNLWNSVTFSVGYTAGIEVSSYDYGWWQPLAWLFLKEPVIPRDHVYTFPITIDNIVAFVGFAGVIYSWWLKVDRLLALWVGIDLLFLLLWPTKWSQYVMILIVPLALAATELLAYLWARWLAYYPKISHQLF